MESLYLLIPVAILLMFVVVGVLFWALRQGQFEDMEGPAHAILMDEETGGESAQSGESAKVDSDQNARVRQNVASDRH
jgi:cbb3-type cytochrome oxidase maturation protein